MRGALIALGAAAAVAFAWWLVRPAADPPGELTAQVEDVGGVEVAVTPVRLDDETALFEVAFSTHTVDLAVGADEMELVVGPVPWGPARWDGDPAGGHHRSGQLSFPARGPATGSAVLSIGGLPEPVTFEWSLGGS
jgi:hypothetical protein